MSSLRSTRRPILLFLDFDGTITKEDTLHLVAKTAFFHNQTSNVPSRASVPPWEHFGEAYMQDFRGHQKRYSPKTAERLSLQQERTWLRSLKAVEKASIDRAIESGLFNIEDPSAAMKYVIQEEQQSIAMRPGLRELLAKVHEINVTSNASILNPAPSSADSSPSFYHILSVNWSRRWIQSVLEDMPTTEIPSCSNRCNNSPIFQVFANEVFNGAAQHASTVPIPAESTFDQVRSAEKETFRHVCCTTSEDKVTQMQQIIQQCREKLVSIPHALDPTLSVYIGDSATDLECLIEADFGICMRDEPISPSQKDLLETCERIGVKQRHISEASLASAMPSQQLWWARDFVDILNWLQESMGLVK